MDNPQNLPDELSPEIIKQRNWSEAELRAMGYEYYERIKELVMVRELPGLEAPKYIRTSWGEVLIAQAGYMICYTPGDKVQLTLDSYKHWPVEPAIFRETYKPWNEARWEPTPPQQHLMKMGCMPYYKSAGIWAKKLASDVFVQSLEHAEPVKVEAGRYVAIGVEGEPYSMGEGTLNSRYASAEEQSRMNRIQKLIKKFLRL